VQTDTLQTIAAYIAIAVPVTVAISNVARILMEWLKQRHSIQSANVEQSHQITTHYLDKALDPSVPLAIRHQPLRFLATPDKSGSRLSSWAESELNRVGGIVDETHKAVAMAEAEIQAAKSVAEIENAERKLADAVLRQRSLFEVPVVPPISASALRAGFVEAKELNGLNMRNEDLSDSQLVYRQLRGSDFSNAKLKDACFQGSDLRATNFSGANLEAASFVDADLRGADFRGPNVRRARFPKARLEAADMRAEGLQLADLRSTYDGRTHWPQGFDPSKAGAVLLPSSTVGDNPVNLEQKSDGG
jgi:uncharacterized protein YjbI with pentapeptide repeats